MSGKIAENCLRSIKHATKLKELNMFVKETFDTATAQAEAAATRVEVKSNYYISSCFQLVPSPKKLSSTR